MRIAVLNGSPKGMTSITMQYVLFLQKKLPQHQFTILHVCQDIKRLEEDATAFAEVLRAVESADAVLWAFPLYVLLVHAHYKRFIELIFERGAQAAFQEKYTAALSTSIHFFDHTAHAYLHGICDDLDMRFVGSYSAAMYDLLEEDERRRLLAFAEAFLRAVEERGPTQKQFFPVAGDPISYQPGPTPVKLSTGGKKVIVVTDADDPQENLGRMTEKLRACFSDPVEVVNLHQIAIRNGCQGCIQCGLDNVCIYRQADEVYATYQKLMPADALIFGGSIKDRYLSSRWKLFWDRGFFHNHVPMFLGKQIGWIISGPLAQIPNLRQILEAGVEFQQANLLGIVTDEAGDSGQLDRLLEGLAGRLVESASSGYVGPPSFFGVAGRKLFRDEIWQSLRFVFHADHRYYKRHGLYDFPKRSLATRLRDATFMLLTKIPSFRREFRKRMRSEMVKPLQELLERL